MKRWWFTVSSYVSYFFRAKSKYVIHSPFVFELMNNVFTHEKPSPELSQLDALKKNIFKRATVVETTDLGAGAGNKDYVTLFRPLGKIARERTLSKKYLHLLFRLVKHLQPHTILEFGTSVGISTVYMGRAVQFNQFVTMEGCAVLSAYASELFEKSGLSNIRVKTGPFDVILDNVLGEFSQLDFVFFDGNHRQQQTITYFEKCQAKSHEHTVFVFDDIHWSPEMAKAWEHIKASEKVSLSIDLHQMGIVFFKKDMAKQHMMIRY